MFFLYSLKPAEHTTSAFMGAFLEEYLVQINNISSGQETSYYLGVGNKDSI